MPISKIEGERKSLDKSEEEEEKLFNDLIQDLKSGVYKKNEEEVLEKILKLRFDFDIGTMELNELIGEELENNPIGKVDSRNLVALAALFSLDEKTLNYVFEKDIILFPEKVKKIKNYIDEVFPEYRAKGLEKLKKQKETLH